MIPNEVLAAWMVAATTAAAALGGLSLLDSRTSPGGIAGNVEVETLPFYYANTGTAWRPRPDRTWRSRLEVTGSLPVRPAAILVDLSDDEVDEIDHKPRRDEVLEGPLATASGSIGFLEP